MVQGLAGIRRARFGAACALIVVCACAWVPAASARQGATGSAAAEKKPTTTKSTTTKTTTRKHHKAAAKASAGSTGVTKSGTTTHSASGGKASSRKKKSMRARGQKKIDSDRAQAIQTALIREHYLNGEASGTWSPASEEAMRRYQADHGWQSKTVPDSRALISLGLGPSHDHLLNPESAMTTGPAAPRAANPAPPPKPQPTTTSGDDAPRPQ